MASSKKVPTRTIEDRARYKRDHLRYPSDLTDSGTGPGRAADPTGQTGRWQAAGRPARGRQWVDVCALATGCQWRAIPKDLPPRSTLYDYFDLWTWDRTL